MIAIRVRDIEWTGPMQDELERRAAFAVDRYGAHLSHISVYLADLNGPKGGVDKICQIRADLKRGKPVLILEKGTKILPAVNRALERLGYCIAQRIHRSRQPERRPIRATNSKHEGTGNNAPWL